MKPTPFFGFRPTDFLCKGPFNRRVKRLVSPAVRKFRKAQLTTKDINKGFYKGTRTGSMGKHTKFGGYIIDLNKVRTYVVPAGLDSFKVRSRQWTVRKEVDGYAIAVLTICTQLTPFVAERIDKPEGDYEGYEGGPKSPVLYLERWKAENGLD
jgi:large subunit ribosomal protein L41